MNKSSSWLANPALHVLLFGGLLVVTPFVMLQNYLQTAVLNITRFSIPLASVRIPLVPTLFFLLCGSLLVLFWKQLNRRVVFTLLFVTAAMAVAQNITDYYLNNRFYDLQINWHYFAYGIFSFLMYRLLKSRNFSPAGIIKITYLSALSISTFDEGIQVFISSRIFDICDIAKDIFGVVLGMILIAFIVEKGAIVRSGWRFRYPRFSEYAQAPLALLFYQIIFALILLFISSNLTHIRYWFVTVSVTAGVFAAIFLLIHSSQFKFPRIIILTGLAILMVGVGTSAIIHWNQPITHCRYGLMVVRGIPIPYFDIMIYENGWFRLVDKKHDFNRRDLLTIYEHTTDILLIATGYDDRGGGGFPEDEIVQFVWNAMTHNVTQVIRLKTPLACEEYNRLKKEGKNVVFIIHSTC